MKKIIFALTVIVLAFLSCPLIAQPAPGQNQGGGAVAGPPIGGGAPIGDGIYVLVALALAYGISRWYAIHKQKTVQE
jgi:hypothetical protein